MPIIKEVNNSYTIENSIYPKVISTYQKIISTNPKVNSTYQKIIPTYSNVISTYPKVISTYTNIKTTLPIYSSVISQKNIANRSAPTNESDSDSPLYTYTIFFLQIQLRGNKIHTYIISDYTLSKDFI